MRVEVDELAVVGDRVVVLDRGHQVGRVVEAALLGDVVVVLRRQERGRMIVLLLRLDHVADVDEPVVPGVLRHHRLIGDVVGQHVGHVAAGERRDDFLHQRRERHEAVIDDVAACLLVLGHHRVERGVLFLHETLDPPHARGFRLGVGDVGTSERRDRGQSDRPTEQRTPAEPAHAISPCRPLPRAAARSLLLLCENVGAHASAVDAGAVLYPRSMILFRKPISTFRGSCSGRTCQPGARRAPVPLESSYRKFPGAQCSHARRTVAKAASCARGGAVWRTPDSRAVAAGYALPRHARASGQSSNHGR